jgi:hypothetical protein
MELQNIFSKVLAAVVQYYIIKSTLENDKQVYYMKGESQWKVTEKSQEKN